MARLGGCTVYPAWKTFRLSSIASHKRLAALGYTPVRDLVMLTFN